MPLRVFSLPTWQQTSSLLRRYSCIAVALAALVQLGTAFGANRDFASQPSSKENRVALVIGNSDYKTSPLENPANDASDLANALEKQGFNVLLRENIGERGLKEAVEIFSKHLKKGGIGLFFFAGHGVQFRDENFLVPVDIGFDSETDLAYKSISAEYVLAKMAEAGNRINIVILDACRNNPFAKAGRSTGKGLGVMNVGQREKGTFIAYATSPGSVASDGGGRNGLYTKHLLRSLEAPDSDIDKVFGRVRTGVVQETSGDQVPWTSSSVIGEFHFNLGSDLEALKNPVKTVATKDEQMADEPDAGPYDAAQEKVHWDRVKDSRNPADYLGYLEKFSGASHAALARWMVTKYGGVLPAMAARQTPAVAPKPAQLAMVVQAPVLSAPPVSAAVTSMGAVPSPGTVIQDCSQCPELVAIPEGEFVMGSNPAEKPREPDEEPAHTVRVDSPFAVGKFEVTRAQYAVFAKETGRSSGRGCYSTRGGRYHKDPKATWQDPGFRQKDDEPVVCVSWDDTQAYVTWLTRKTGKTYRLLNEAEWEYVARAGSTGKRYWTEADDASVCRYASVADTSVKGVSPGMPVFSCSDGFPFTSPVGRFPPNAFGVHDMLGNAWEWVEDCWNEGYVGAPNLAQARLSGACTERVFRGGAWDSTPATMRLAYRDRETKDDRHDNLGFRVARTLP